MSLPPFLQTTPPPVPPPSQARLKALYASTSTQKESNPTGYQANVTWWTGIIEECLRTGWLGDHRFVLRVDENLVERFENAEGGRPKGLGGVVETMLSPQAKLYPLSTFLSSPTPINNPGSLAYRLLARPILWTVGRLNPFGGESVEKEEVVWKRLKGKEYVHLPLLERAASNIIKHMEDNPPIEYSDCLYSLATFRDVFGTLAIPSRTSGERALPKGETEHKLSERDIEVLIRWLSRDAGVVITDGKVIKIIRDEADEITEADIGTLTILSTIKSIDAQIDSLSVEITNTQSLAKTRLASGQKTLALASLRSKKRLEEILSKRLASSEQLQKVLTSINTAQNDVEVMNAYETATKTLKGILATPTLDLERVERTTEEMAEVLALQEEVDSAIRVGGSVAVGAGGVVVDEDELERELEGLVLDEKKAKEEEQERNVVREKERVERAEREEREKKEKKEKKEKEGREKEKVQQTYMAKQDKERTPEDVWQETYDTAQQRQREEAARAEIERMRREEKRVAAE